MTSVQHSCLISTIYFHPLSSNTVQTGHKFNHCCDHRCLAPKSARPSAGLVLTEKFHIISSKIFWLLMFLYYFHGLYNVIHGGQQNLLKSQIKACHMLVTKSFIFWTKTDLLPIVQFHKDFPPSGEQLELHKLAHELKQPTAGCVAIFHKYCWYTKRGGIIASLTLWNHWGYVTNVSKYHNAGKLSMD